MTQSQIESQAASRVLDLTSAEELKGMAPCIAKQVKGDFGWYIQLDLHGEDLEGPYDTQDEAMDTAKEAVEAGEVRGVL